MSRVARAVAFCMLSLTIAAKAQTYFVTDLGTLGGTASGAYGINSSGQVVGLSTTAADVNHAFLYQNGQMADIGTLGGTTSVAYGINDNHQIVGYANTLGDLTLHAFCYQNNTMNDLGTLGGSWSTAWGINGNGQVIGAATTSAGDSRAFLYQNSTMSSLGTLGGTSNAYGINEGGQIVGAAVASADSALHAFLYQNGTMNDLGTGTGSNSVASAINKSGQIVGYTFGNGYEHPFLYTNGTMNDLAAPSGSGGAAKAINSKGQIVGFFGNAGDQHAFVYQNGMMTDLNALTNSSGSAWTLMGASGINDAGQIVGSGLHNGQGRAFLLTPTPVTQQVVRIPTIAPPSPGGQLLVFDRLTQSWSASLSLQADKDTIVLTHGYKSGASQDFPHDTAVEIAQASATANVVAWDWGAASQATYAGWVTNAEGSQLAQALFQKLGLSYSGEMHFIGHSLGTLVNRQAIDSLHNTLGIDPLGTKTDVTLLDAPEIVPPDPFNPGITATNSNPIPQHYHSLDNYIAAFGNLHDGAANIYLSQGLPVVAVPPVTPEAIAALVQNIKDFHSYAHQWYQDSVFQPQPAKAGYGVAPTPDTYFRQTAFGSELALNSITKSEAQTLLLERNAIYVGGSQATLLPVDALRGTIKVVGNVAATGIVKAEAAIPGDTGPLYVTTPSVTLTGPGAAYAWCPVSVPADGVGLSFDATFKNVPAGDSLTVGIGDQVLYTLAGQDAQDGAMVSSGALDVSQWAGQDVELFFGLFPVGTPPPQSMEALSASPATETIGIDSISFISTPEPSTGLLVLVAVVALRRHRKTK